MCVVFCTCTLTCDVKIYDLLAQFGLLRFENNEKLCCHVGPYFPLLNHKKERENNLILTLTKGNSLHINLLSNVFIYLNKIKSELMSLQSGFRAVLRDRY